METSGLTDSTVAAAHAGKLRQTPAMKAIDAKRRIFTLRTSYRYAPRETIRQMYFTPPGVFCRDCGRKTTIRLSKTIELTRDKLRQASIDLHRIRRNFCRDACDFWRPS